MNRFTHFAINIGLVIVLAGCTSPGSKARKWILPKETLPSQTQVNTPKDVKTLLKEPSSSSDEETMSDAGASSSPSSRSDRDRRASSPKNDPSPGDSSDVERAMQWDREAQGAPAVALTSGQDHESGTVPAVKQASGSTYARQRLTERTRLLVDEVRSRAPDRVPALLEDIREGASHGTWEDVLQAWELSMDMAPASVPTRSSVSGAESLSKRVERARQMAREDRASSTTSNEDDSTPRTDDIAASDAHRDAKVEAVMTLNHSLKSSEGNTRRLPYRKASSTTPVDDVAPSTEVDFRGWAHALETHAAHNPDSAAEWEAYSRLIHAMAREGSQALETVGKFDATQQRFWKNYTFAMMRYFDDLGLAKPEQRAAAAGAALRDSMDALSELSQLEITDPLFCKSVASFGNYVEFPAAEFKAGDGVVIYWEARHFTSTDSPEGYRTRMRATFDILDANGSVVHSFEQRFKDDVCRRKRTDYFNVVVFEWPKTLTPGKYTLKVRVTDSISEKSCERSRGFEIRP